MKLVEELQNIGKEYNATAGQVALAWLLSQGEDVIPIPGTKKIKVGTRRKSVFTSQSERACVQYLEENLAAARIMLSPQAVQKVRAVAEEAELDGGRYPPQIASQLYGDTPAYNKA